ncbi:hypothetical protein DZ860_10740 [Vibrio sinensis]|uniref:Solute-binding protein family 3/N-terminal domain-containing protein n=1 Tax=Vibrio sinensis TaxID=2302434 RepID=A0A3A6QRJ4_9VIBR|nr:transporter substrate-binding domain-containing protein [Vibrio sinensis]RJX71411.1 hypothetical protein DZ860_10740 [Vibrio sinensis]
MWLNLKYLVLIFALLGSFYSNANVEFSESEMTYLKNKKVLVAGVLNYEWLPYWGGISTPSGIHHQYFSELAGRAGLTLEYKGFENRNAIIRALEQGQIDIATGIPCTEKACQDLAETRPLYMAHKIVWLRNKLMKAVPHNNWSWVCLDNSIDCDLLKTAGYQSILKADSLRTTAKLLKHNSADATITTLLELNQFIDDPVNSEGEIIWDQRLGRIPVGFVMPKSSSILSNIVNKYVTVCTAKSKLQINNAHMLNGESNWLLARESKDSTTVRYTIEDDIFPLSYIDPTTQEISGYVHDILDLLERKTLLKFEYVPAKGKSLDEMLSSGVVDLLPARFIVNKNNQFRSTNPYTTISLGYVETRQPYGEKNLGILDRTGQFTQKYLSQLPIRGITFFNQAPDLLEGLLKGDISHGVLDLDVIDNHIYLNQGSVFKVLPLPERYNIDTRLTMQVRPSSELLYKVLSSGLSLTTKNEIRTLRNQHSQILVNYGYNKDIVIHYTLVAISIFILFLLGAALSVSKLSNLLNKMKNSHHLSQKEVSMLSNLINSLPNSVFITNQDGILVFANRKVQEQMMFCEELQLCCKDTECQILDIVRTMSVPSTQIISLADLDCGLMNQQLRLTKKSIDYDELDGVHFMIVAEVVDITTDIAHGLVAENENSNEQSTNLTPQTPLNVPC